jgi:hypothetical protein
MGNRSPAEEQRFLEILIGDWLREDFFQSRTPGRAAVAKEIN